MNTPSERVKFFKTLEVILSCETKEQLMVSERFAELAGLENDLMDILKDQITRKIKTVDKILSINV